MSSRFLKLEMLLALIFFGTVITSTYGNIEYFEYVLFKNALKSMIKDPLKNESYENAELIYAKDLQINDEHVWELSLSIRNHCDEQKCTSKKCDIYIQGDDFSDLTNISANCSTVDGQDNFYEQSNFVRTDLFKAIVRKEFFNSLIKNTLKNEVYTLALLSYAEIVPPSNGSYKIWEVSILLENYPVLPCQRRRCDVYFKQDESDKLIANDKPEQCRCILNKDNSPTEEETLIGVPIRPFFGDREVAGLVEKIYMKRFHEYYDVLVSPSLVNATRINVENGVKYEIYFNLDEYTYEPVGSFGRDYSKNIINEVQSCKIEASIKDICEPKIPKNSAQKKNSVKF